MMAQIPKSRPQLDVVDIERILKHRKNTDKVALIGIRGYFLDSMGKPGENDRKIYDDAIFLVVRGEQGKTTKVYRFNANCDPGAFRKGIANLKSGSWRYKVGIHGVSKPAHRRYTALVQAAPVAVERDGKGEDVGWFGINIHRGGYSTTSSEGCQTIPPGQWDQFIGAVKGELAKAKQAEIIYELMFEGDRRKYLGDAN
jgi:lysozyme